VISSLAHGNVLVERYGDQPVDIICLHGWGRSATDFASVCEGHNAASVYLPGFGTIDPPPGPWTPSDYATWLAEAIDPNRPAIVVGHSFGGRIAVRLAARRPDLVRGLVLTGVPLTKLHHAKGPDWRYALIRSLHGLGVVSERQMESARRRFGSADYRAAQGVMREILVKTVAEDYLDDLASINAPVELVWGEHDRPAPLEVAKIALGKIPHGQLTVANGSEHLLDATLVELLREAIDRLLAQTERPAS
jgi:pimeloyl-ACP methyl ester carboxylesterase